MAVLSIKTLVMRFLDEPWNKGNVDVIDELCAPEYTLRFMGDKKVGGREDLKKAALESRKAPDFCATLDEMIVEKDRVAYQWTMSCTVNGTFTKSVGMTFLRFKNGKIIEDRFVAVDVKPE